MIMLLFSKRRQYKDHYFENIIHDRIIDALQGLLVNEFTVPVYVDEHRGNQSFLLTPETDTINEYGNNFQARNYAIEIKKTNPITH